MRPVLLLIIIIIVNIIIKQDCKRLKKNFK